MPVKCSVLDIIKQRKLLGKEYFEVSWNNFHGPESSVVPADLIKSACPEKIGEYEEKKTQGKQRNHKKTKNSKSQNKSPTAELDQQLQDLLFDTNLETHSVESNSAVFAIEDLRADCSLVSTKVEAALQDMTAKEKSNIRNSYDRSIHVHASSCVLKTEVIDLSSPSPPMRACKISNRKVMIKPPDAAAMTAQQIDVVVLSDAEFDDSPYHLRKARELRSFIER